MSDYPDCRRCGDNFWILYEKSGVEYAEACPDCKPDVFSAFMDDKFKSGKSIIEWFNAAEKRRGAERQRKAPRTQPETRKVAR